MRWPVGAAAPAAARRCSPATRPPWRPGRIPARYNFTQGYIYRLKLTNIPGRPGVSLYPTIEVAPSTPATDAYLAHNPIPVQFTAEDFDQVVDGGNFVTKVIYLPDPKYQELAIAGVETLVSTRLEPGVDPILEADKRGTILLIVRLGAIDLEMPGGPVVGAVVGPAAPTVVNGAPGPAAAPAPAPAPGGALRRGRARDRHPSGQPPAGRDPDAAGAAGRPVTRPPAPAPRPPPPGAGTGAATRTWPVGPRPGPRPPTPVTRRHGDRSPGRPRAPARSARASRRAPRSGLGTTCCPGGTAQTATCSAGSFCGRPPAAPDRHESREPGTRRPGPPTSGRPARLHPAFMSRIKADGPTRNESRRRAWDAGPSRRSSSGSSVTATRHHGACPASGPPASPLRPRAAGPRRPPRRPAPRQPPPQPHPGRAHGARARPLVARCVGPLITPEGHGPEGPPALDPRVQVVRFQGPDGLNVEVLGPIAKPGPGRRRRRHRDLRPGAGVGYRLRLTNLPERPGAELFPVIEVVGHLHRPREIDPAKFPIRVVFSDDELWDAVDRGRLVTQVIYLEDPEQAIPHQLAEGRDPGRDLNPSEEPLKVASALGRVMAIVRIGGRQPTAEEMNAGATGDLGLDAVAAVTGGTLPVRRHRRRPLPAALRPGLRHAASAGPALAAPRRVPLRRRRPGTPADVGGDGGLAGHRPARRGHEVRRRPDDRAAPRPADEPGLRLRPRGSPRSGSAPGPTRPSRSTTPSLNRSLDKYAEAESRSYSRRLVQNQAAELARERRRAQDLDGRVFAGEDSEPARRRRLPQRPAGPHGFPAAAGRDRPHPREAGPDEGEAPARRDQDRRIAGDDRARRGARARPSCRGSPTSDDGRRDARRTGRAWPSSSASAPARPSRATRSPSRSPTATWATRRSAPSRSSTASCPGSSTSRARPGAPRGPAFSVGENRVGSTELRWDLPGVIAPGPRARSRSRRW